MHVNRQIKLKNACIDLKICNQMAQILHLSSYFDRKFKSENVQTTIYGSMITTKF